MDGQIQAEDVVRGIVICSGGKMSERETMGIFAPGYDWAAIMVRIRARCSYPVVQCPDGAT